MKASCVSLIFGLAALQFGQTDSAGHSVILELPKLPVIRGSDVTLQCKSSDGSKPTMFFFRNGSFIGHRSTGEFTISDVQQTDEGLYHCSAGFFSSSEKTWLSVTDPPPPLSVLRLLCHLVVVCPYIISTILMVCVCCGKRRGHKAAVSMEMDPRANGGQRPSAERDNVTKRDF